MFTGMRGLSQEKNREMKQSGLKPNLSPQNLRGVTTAHKNRMHQWR